MRSLVTARSRRTVLSSHHRVSPPCLTTVSHHRVSPPCPALLSRPAVADTQIKDESYLEDINGLLNAGEVPNLFASDEKAQICDAVRDVARNEGAEGDGSNTTMFAYFVTRCRALLHICLAMSPIGEAFRRRLRMFPSLVNCCTSASLCRLQPAAARADGRAVDALSVAAVQPRWSRRC
jgi:hypothetical protein